VEAENQVSVNQASVRNPTATVLLLLLLFHMLAIIHASRQQRTVHRLLIVRGSWGTAAA
jgi:hypothetical protein